LKLRSNSESDVIAPRVSAATARALHAPRSGRFGVCIEEYESSRRASKK